MAVMYKRQNHENCVTVQILIDPSVCNELFHVSLLVASMDRRCRNGRMRWMGLSHPSAARLSGYAEGRRCCPVLAALAVPLPVTLKRRSPPPSLRAAAQSPCHCCVALSASWTVAMWKTHTTLTTTRVWPSLSPSSSLICSIGPTTCTFSGCFMSMRVSYFCNIS